MHDYTNQPPTPQAAVEVDHLYAHYGPREVLHDINLTIGQGEIHVIMGGSGSGKSTLLRHMLGLNRPSAGRLKLLGQDMNNSEISALQELRRNIGVLFQGGAMLASLTVAENVQLPLREHTRLDENTIQIMTRMKLGVVSLPGFENFMPAELSGGMLKRAALARAIIMDPKVLFCDEPSAGLDPGVAAGIDELILRLRDAMRMTIVVVSHDLVSAFRIADRLTMLDRGQILITGAPQEVQSCEHERVQRLLRREHQEDILDPEAYLQQLTETID
ncbi:MAG: ABC transporter ATP-binding protein [Candidatus Muproteobacteria bacterium RIFCSPHIGHO2_12_FULL_60_33]|uniref:ABC transporter ATP-binding protein n=1 Tax=Candidatus Muproteobacteria bacterium RIFCSPLOWO2_01_FULL_60_18 TaxID=1817768 RepID=A0A1F6U1E4_9PROT|nr:MAG: ABC transporter ATP-binding protein [Candidatus Muproteobacteria bacterium RIFCSPLOWO2_01_FULL_60_18]OGI53623.1 MAG: ABC transporter ATP-binding protein [Candidatus Muproteobacteria bacterium RIFCSPHIGHO2_01_60_12]OGI56366.1 MAG: ABC transporter ATP-binding protein [Candidatus Muproteobacteria bacterium RIFCSPHIGHO2_12_FULL_60_33]OGI56778.1 MAG: ABC transporter ATP-binding protein [Candidatus Muproteobacteria bacterium RIFCSPHIGHO2_02_FULL_60_13]